MATTSGISSVTQGTPLTAPAPAAVPAAGSVSSITAKPLTKDTTTGISPHIVVDPLAGVITQFLSSTGQVQSQIPSSAVVAYLRAGLNSDGLAKPSTAPHAKPQTADSGGAAAGSSTVA
ncbi:MAG TPA: hypothetical protein VMV79_08375 [Alphaproteobacteria bacterium]|nr:hypothetical protein [Alphaproteobacteria bacterium]